MKAKIIVAIIWGYFIFCGISGGIGIPDSGMKYSFQAVPVGTKLGFTLFPFVFFFIGGFFMCKAQEKPSRVNRSFEKILGSETYEEIKRMIHLQILGPLFFVLIGSIGLIKARIIGLTGFGIYQLLFPLCTGMGLAMSFAVNKLYKNMHYKRSDRERS